MRYFLTLMETKLMLFMSLGDKNETIKKWEQH